MSVGMRLAIPATSPRSAAFMAGRDRWLRLLATALSATAATLAILVVAVAAIALGMT